MAHINYKLNPNSRDRAYVDEWIEELKEESINDEPITLTFSHEAVKEMIKNQFD